MTDNQSRPRVSVCIPAYNNENYIGETIESILGQTFADLELIIVDDGSHDGTYVIAENYASRDPRVKLYRNEENLGMSGNWNRCLSLCRGEYIKLICADDLIEPTLLEREVKILDAHPEALMVSTDTAFRNNEGQFTGTYRRYHASGAVEGRRIARFSLFTRDYLGAPLANTFRRSAYEELGGFDPAFSYIVDYDFFMKIAIHGRVYILHEPLNIFRVRNDSNTGEVMHGDRGQDYIEEHRKLVEKYATTLGIGRAGIRISVAIRRFMSFLGRIYLIVFAR